MRRSSILTGCVVIGALVSGSYANAAHRFWLDKANADPRTAQSNPYEGQAAATQAGQKLYQRYCSSCHGKQAEGIGRNPSLHSPVTKQATPGALFWLLRNGSLRKGMPSWSYLPPEQRWQIVTYLKSF